MSSDLGSCRPINHLIDRKINEDTATGEEFCLELSIMTKVREIHDFYFKEAKRKGYAARSAYKLLEIHEKKNLFRKGDRVLDLGCAPGAWLQVSCQLIGPTKVGGLIVGVDLKAVKKQSKFWDDRIHTIEGDAFASETAEAIKALADGKLFNVVLSDMMGSTTGHRSTDHLQSVHVARGALALSQDYLVPGGALVAKVFEGAEYHSFVGECRELFKKVKGFSPMASRKDSTEMYVIAQDRKPIE